MKKRIFAILLAAILMFCFVSCGEKTPQETEEINTTPQTEPATETNPSEPEVTYDETQETDPAGTESVPDTTADTGSNLNYENPNDLEIDFKY